MRGLGNWHKVFSPLCSSSWGQAGECFTAPDSGGPQYEHGGEAGGGGVVFGRS